MPEISIIHIGIATAAALAGIVIGWMVRSKLAKQEKNAISSGWKEQIESQRGEHGRLIEQNKSLMEQVNQFKASSKDATNRAKELSEALKEAFARRDELQREIKDVRGNLESMLAQRKRLESGKGDAAGESEKDDKIFRLSRELENWQNRLPPLIDKFRERDTDAQRLESELAEAHAKIEDLESRLTFDQTLVEPAAAVPEELDASNETIVETFVETSVETLHAPTDDTMSDALDGATADSPDETLAEETLAKETLAEETLAEETLAEETPGESLDGTLAETMAESPDGTLAETMNESLDGTLAETMADPVDGTLAETMAESPDGALAETVSESLDGTLSESITESLDGTLAETMAESPDETMSGSLDGTLAETMAETAVETSGEPEAHVATQSGNGIDHEEYHPDDRDTDSDHPTDHPVDDRPDDSTDGDSALRDNLQMIKGVGPAIEKTLNELGIFRYSQIAGMSEYDIDRIAKRLKGFRSRIYREDWIGQARELDDQHASGL